MAKTIGDVAILQTINKKLDQIIATQKAHTERLDQIWNQLNTQDQYISPALETAVNSVSKMADTIDAQVPDINVPPSPGTEPQTRKKRQVWP